MSLLKNIVLFLLIAASNWSKGYCQQQDDYYTDDHISLNLGTTASHSSFSSEKNIFSSIISSRNSDHFSSVPLTAIPQDCWYKIGEFIGQPENYIFLFSVTQYYRENFEGTFTNNNFNHKINQLSRQNLLYFNIGVPFSNDFIGTMLPPSSFSSWIEYFCCGDPLQDTYAAPTLMDFPQLTTLIVRQTINTREKAQAISSLIRQSVNLTYLDVSDNFSGLVWEVSNNSSELMENKPLSLGVYKENSSKFQEDQKLGEYFWQHLLDQEDFPKLTYFNCQRNRASLQEGHLINLLAKMPNLTNVVLAMNGKIFTKQLSSALSIAPDSFLKNIQEFNFNETFIFDSTLYQTSPKNWLKIFVDFLNRPNSQLKMLSLNGCNLHPEKNSLTTFIWYHPTLRILNLRKNNLNNNIIQSIMQNLSSSPRLSQNESDSIINLEDETDQSLEFIEIDIRDNLDIIPDKIINPNPNYIKLKHN